MRKVRNDVREFLYLLEAGNGDCSFFTDNEATPFSSEHNGSIAEGSVSISGCRDLDLVPDKS
jgi:hypothetical protein